MAASPYADPRDLGLAILPDLVMKDVGPHCHPKNPHTRQKRPFQVT